MPEDDFEREKWKEEVRLRERELKLKSEEVALLRNSTSHKGWTNPIFVALVAAAAALIGNVWIANKNSEIQQQLEKTKADHTRVLDALFRTMDDEWEQNIRRLLDVELVSDPDLRGRIESYLSQRGPSTAEPMIFSGCDATEGDGTCVGCLQQYGQCTITNKDNKSRKNSASWTFKLPQPGYYKISLKYAAKEARPGRIVVNGKPAKDKNAFSNTNGSWTVASWFRETCTKFKQGENTIQIESDEEQPNVFPHIQNLMLLRVEPSECSNATDKRQDERNTN